MSSTLAPQILLFKAGAAISKGMAVKHDSSDDHVIKSALGSEKHIGLAQSAPTTAEDLLEVAVAGGAKGLAGAGITRGDLVTSGTDGKLVATTTPNDRVIGVAMESASSGDLFSVLLAPSNY